MESEKASSAVNQQVTLYCRRSLGFYYSGFTTGEISCSIIRAGIKSGRCYYRPDFTLTNNDKRLLEIFNEVFGNQMGIISKVKGAFNISFRGIRKVAKILNFFDEYPIIAGDIAKTKLLILKEAVSFLQKRAKPTKRYTTFEIETLECLIKKLVNLKSKGFGVIDFKNSNNFSHSDIGFFLSGLVDSEGSFGFKGKRLQQFFALAMKDCRSVLLLKEFLGFGKVRQRLDGLYHFEVSKKDHFYKCLTIFGSDFPLRHKEKSSYIQGLLNDYTRES